MFRINLDIKKFIIEAALEAGFSRARVLSPFEPDKFLRRNSGYQPVCENHLEPAKSLLVCALAYGNRHENIPPPAADETCPGVIAPFARFNYYREAVKRLKKLSLFMRTRLGGEKRHYRILCNSPVPEKPLAAACGLGAAGRNGLIISPEAGQLFVIAAMTLPMFLEPDPPIDTAYGTGGLEFARKFALCKGCACPPPCVLACPTGAALGNGHINRSNCIQWYASGGGISEPDIPSSADTGIPPPVLAAWGNRLYGCVSCQDACIHNKRPIQGVQTSEGALPAFIDALRLVNLPDMEIKAFFHGTAMGMSWLGPEVIRRNARFVLNSQKRGRAQEQVKSQNP
jgi:epoxyqueuosine reductase